MATKTDQRKAKPTGADKMAALRLRALWDREQANPLREKFTQESAGAQMGLGNQSLVSQYLKGDIPLNFKALMAFSRFLGVEPTEIRDDLSEQRLVGGGNDSAGWDDVLGYAQGAGLGDGVEAAEYAETHSLKFKADSLRRKNLNPRNLAVIYGQGESMLPRIRSGDAIMFDTSDTTPRDEELFVIQAQGVARGEYSVKRCRHFGDEVYFDSLNPEGDHNWRKPRSMNDPKRPITIIGRVRWIGSWEG